MSFDPIDAVMVWISAHGLIGLFAIALAERFIPILPSYAFLLTVGIAASEGAWSLSTALLVTTIGSVAGCSACFYAARLVNSETCMRFIKSAARLFGMSPHRIDGWMMSLRSNQTVLAFSLQIIPTVRLFAPAFAAIFRVEPRKFLAASAAGIAVWNGVFIGVGYMASRSAEAVNTTVLALAALFSILLVEAALFWISRRWRARQRRIPASARFDDALGGLQGRVEVRKP
jgi:membrane protein DedA with SNARE-associated domain